MSGILGKKIGMTSVFNDRGESVPCTVIEAGPCYITQIKTIDNDGYEALQLGFEEKKEILVNRPIAGHFKRANVKPKRVLREFRGFDVKNSRSGRNQSGCSIRKRRSCVRSLDIERARFPGGR